jgi:SulP family sulfate permease
VSLGAVGDIGVLFPIAIAFISLNHMNPTAVFLAAGLAYILAGAYFRIPMSVQPFKSVAAIALVLALPPSSIATAGLLMGALLAVLAITNLVTVLARLFSLPIIRGVQLGLGLILVREGLRLIFGSEGEPALAVTATIASWEIALGGAMVLLVFLQSRRFPAALMLLIGGIVLGPPRPWSRASFASRWAGGARFLTPERGGRETDVCYSGAAAVRLDLPEFHCRDGEHGSGSLRGGCGARSKPEH